MTWTIKWHLSYEGQEGVSVDGERPAWTSGPSPETWGTACVAVDVAPVGEIERLREAFWAWESVALSAETDPEEQQDATDLWQTLLAAMKGSRP